MGPHPTSTTVRLLGRGSCGRSVSTRRRAAATETDSFTGNCRWRGRRQRYRDDLAGFGIQVPVDAHHPLIGRRHMQVAAFIQCARSQQPPLPNPTPDANTQQLHPTTSPTTCVRYRPGWPHGPGTPRGAPTAALARIRTAGTPMAPSAERRIRGRHLTQRFRDPHRVGGFATRQPAPICRATTVVDRCPSSLAQASPFVKGPHQAGPYRRQTTQLQSRFRPAGPTVR